MHNFFFYCIMNVGDNMKNINSKELHTERLDLRIPTMEEQHRLWEVLCIEEVNRYYFPTPDRIFIKNNLSKDNIDDLKKARKIFIEQLTNWDLQKPFYEKKIESIKKQENSQKFTWSIFIKDTDIVIGQITCQPKDGEEEKIRDMGWYLDPKYQGNGYMTEAALAMLDFMFNEVEIDKIETGVAEINPKSWKILEKYGFKYTGNSKITYFKDNEILYLKEYYITKEMYNKKVRFTT